MKFKTFFKTIVRCVAAAVIFSITFQCSEEQFTPEAHPIDSTKVTASAITAPLSCSTCTYVIPANKYTIDGKVLGFKPGDVICLSSTTVYKSLAFNNIIGTADNPIIITNCGGTALIDATGQGFGIRTQNSKYFRISGGATDNTYGIKCTGATSSGLILGYLSSDFEIDHLEIANTGFAGVMAKTDPSCNVETQRGNYTMRNISFHHNYVHDTGGEGFYLGHSSYNGVSNSTCGLLLPHLIENIRIYRNHVKNSGWDAIQLSSAPRGAQIYANKIENYAMANKASQNSGICIGGGTGGVCFGNFIHGGTGPGMSVFGITDNVVHNNIILDAGNVGIFCDERTTTLGMGYRIIHNTIINSKSDGIKIYSEKVQNAVINNIIVNPGSYVAIGSKAYVSTLSTSVPLRMLNNYTTMNIADVKFVNAAAFNYRLNSTSPAIDKGYNISTYAITRDFYASSRFKGLQYDIGASEY
jgi:hypothetical protein